MPPADTQPPQPPVGTLFDRISAHPYFIVVGTISILLFLGLFIVMQRTGVSGVQSRTTWTSNGSIFLGNKGSTPPKTDIPPLDIIRERTAQDTLPTIPLPTEILSDATDTAFTGDLEELLSLISTPSSTTSPDSPANTPEGFSLIPQGLLSVDSNIQKRTALQYALYNYGNMLGTYIQSFEAMHENSAQILKDHFEDRSNPEKTAAVLRMGEDYAQLGLDILIIETVPEAAKSAHQGYATSYSLLGTQLQSISKTTNDEDFLKAVETYNAHVEGLAKRFFTLTTVFSSHTVSFSRSEPGSIFMFTGNLGL